MLSVVALVSVSEPSAVRAAPVYYLALGDSLARGIAASPGQGYVDDVFAFAQQTMPDLQLVNLSCSGETTGTMINGGTCAYTTGSQLGDAVEFLSSHPASSFSTAASTAPICAYRAASPGSGSASLSKGEG